MKKAIWCAATAIALSSPAAMAFESGDIVLRGGLTHVAPNDDSGKVYTEFGSLGTTQLEVGVSSDTQLGINLVYFYSPKIAVELLAATPFSHDINLQNDNLSLGNGALGSTKHLPPTLSVLYYFAQADAALQPYVGVGLNYTTFFEEDFEASRKSQGFSDLKLDDSFGLAVQIGADYMLNEHWMVNGSIRYIDIDTTADFKLGGQNSHVDVDIDPFVSTLSVGYKF
ncbi:OmpW/AlkL family protein [Motiliproteus sediminis]|uniref:OmpW/AlkL family protein n=1 Tax=Motiliproteus sediminis TaxID=1468178 RepID=UPI001FE5E3B8|nr:OmpW family outer membrane protein [Motiliproteus sediminis]